MCFRDDEERILAAAVAALEVSAKCDSPVFADAKTQAQGVALNTVALVLLGINGRCGKAPEAVAVSNAFAVNNVESIGADLHEALANHVGALKKSVAKKARARKGRR